MCYSALVKSDLKKLESQFGAEAVKELWDWVYETHKSDPKKIKLPGSDHRIFPKYIAPAMYQKDNKIVIEPMRYSVPTPSFIDPKINKYTTFNARFDNLDSRFWSEAFMVHHGFIVLEKFYEWVSVAKLIKAGVVGLNEVKSEFGNQSENRKLRIENAGKVWKPTKTELKDPRFRDTIISFSPQNNESMMVPVIFSMEPTGEEKKISGFAIITDSPNKEVLQAGHDRMPICLNKEGIDRWLEMGHSKKYYLECLTNYRTENYFSHLLEVS